MTERKLAFRLWFWGLFNGGCYLGQRALRKCWSQKSYPNRLQEITRIFCSAILQTGFGFLPLKNAQKLSRKRWWPEARRMLNQQISLEEENLFSGFLRIDTSIWKTFLRRYRLE